MDKLIKKSTDKTLLTILTLSTFGVIGVARMWIDSAPLHSIWVSGMFGILLILLIELMYKALTERIRRTSLSVFMSVGHFSKDDLREAYYEGHINGGQTYAPKEKQYFMLQNSGWVNYCKSIGIDPNW